MCEKHDRKLSNEDQGKTCDDHLVLPGLLEAAIPYDSGKHKDGGEYIGFQYKRD